MVACVSQTLSSPSDLLGSGVACHQSSDCLRYLLCLYDLSKETVIPPLIAWRRHAAQSLHRFGGKTAVMQVTLARHFWRILRTRLWLCV
jgi:hypothetical protein